jgi:hypothetical protein
VPATTTQVRQRAAARRDALARQQKLNEERQRRDEQELDLAADFAVFSEECETARAAVRAAELALGRIVDTLIGGLRIRYERAAQLLDTTEDELKRLRQVATGGTDESAPPAIGASTRPVRRARGRPPRPPSPAPAARSPDADGDQDDLGGHTGAA